jgi:DNA topoisomerase-2
MAPPTIEERYKKLSQKEHVLHRSGMYIGQIKKVSEECWVYKDEKMVKKIVNYSPAFLKIVDEIISNATDHSFRDETCNQIKINHDDITGQIIVFNDGQGIPIEIHKEHNIYVPELIFGHLLSGSNYDDTQQRVGAGTNGLGSKATAIFCKEFKVEIVSKNKRYIQTFNNNLSDIDKPIISKVSKTTKEYTRITFTPDYPRFEMKGLEKDTILLLNKRIIDATICTNKNVNVYLNDKKISCKGLKDYTKLFFNESVKVIHEEYIEKGLTWEYAIVPHDNFEQVSFVNGNNTSQGGSHVNCIISSVTSKLKVLIESKKKVKDIKPSYIKEKIFLFLRATVVNPSFNSQTKETLTTAFKDFGIYPKISEEFIIKIYKSSIVSDIVELCKFKEQSALAKTTDGKKTSKLYIKKLEDALWAGTSRGKECTLILTEGDSALTFAMWGRSVIGVEKYGCFPLKGKVINIRDASNSQLLNNEEINNLKQIIGLKSGMDYKNVNDLRYGKIMLLTDSDNDGLHIKSLVMNLFHYWYPSLLKLDFINTISTPMVKATKGKIVKEFFNEQDYNKWQETVNISNYKIKFFKGLGTSKKEDAIETFKNMSKLKVEYFYKDNDCDKSIELAFEKDKNIKKMTSVDDASEVSDTLVKCSDKRKEWLSGYDRNVYIDNNERNVCYADFINKGLIHFSIYDNSRSIPHLCDGLKPSQRKILYYMIHKNITSDIKVAQLSGYVSAEMSYHHGEVSLQGAIINMAQDFIGSNNINLLVPEGNFGSRYANKSSASPRYIFTRLSELSTSLFDKRDLPLLNYLVDDGKKVEPDFFVPIIPNVLVNGCEGIGTGYSTFIPPFNPIVITQNLLNIIDNKDVTEMIPYYKNFSGKMEKVSHVDYTSKGLYTKISDKKIRVTELPVGCWVSGYKEFLESLLDIPKNVKNATKSTLKKLILKDVINLTKDEETGINFEIEFISAKCMAETDILKELKLIKKIKTSNMYLFNEKMILTKYESVYDILKEFYNIRLTFYNTRRDYTIKALTLELQLLSNKCRFIQMYIDNPSIINNKNKNEIYNILEKHKFDKIDNEYDYLLSLKLWNLTSEKIKALTAEKQKVQSELKFFNDNTSKSLWKIDLQNLIKKLG